MTQSYINLTEVAREFHWNEMDLRTLPRLLGYALTSFKVKPGGRGRGRARTLFEVTDVINMLDKCLASGLDANRAKRLRALAKTPDQLNQQEFSQ